MKNKQNPVVMALPFSKNDVYDNLRPLDEPPKAQQCLEHCLLQKFSMKEVSSESFSGTLSFLLDPQRTIRLNSVLLLRLTYHEVRFRQCKTSLQDTNMTKPQMGMLT